MFGNKEGLSYLWDMKQTNTPTMSPAVEAVYNRLSNESAESLKAYYREVFKSVTPEAAAVSSAIYRRMEQVMGEDAAFNYSEELFAELVK